MKKLLKLNCSEEKKEKLMLYFNSFLGAFLCFDREGNVAIREGLEGDAEGLIAEAISRLEWYFYAKGL